MNRKEVNNFVKQSISLILEKDGYKYVSLAENFHLKNDDFTYKIGWSCVERWKSCEIGYYIAIRSEKVSKIYNLFSGAQPKYHKQVSNFTLPFTYFTEEQLYKENISVCDATKEKYIINSFLPVYEKKIKPFLEEYSSLEKIASFMINKIDNDDIYGDQFSYYKTSIILLKLTNSPHFSERAKSYQHILKDYVEWQQEQFKKLIEYLETI